jgi:predicted nucleotidyltransferase
MMHIEEIATALRTWAEAQPHVDALWLFGSCAKGTQHSGSDVDIAVLFAQGHAPTGMARLDLMVDLSDSVHSNVDVVVMNTAGELISNQVLSTGMRLYSRNATRTALFEIAERGKYDDFKRIKDHIISVRKAQLHAQR